MRISNYLIPAILGFGLPVSSGCASDGSGNSGFADTSSGTGRVAMTTYGEEFIESGMPASEFSDGWSVHFTKFLYVLRSVKLASSKGPVAINIEQSKLFDMTKKGPHEVASVGSIPAREWDQASFRIGPVQRDTVLGNASAADLAMMLNGGASGAQGPLSIYVEGNAMKEGEPPVSFKWPFTTDTLYSECKAEVGGKKTAGVVVTNGGRESVEITIHGDHFFLPDLQAEDVRPTFGPIAQAANSHGEITLEALRRVLLVSIDAKVGPYGVGGASTIHDLAEFLTALSRTIGHFRGEGECISTPL